MTATSHEADRRYAALLDPSARPTLRPPRASAAIVPWRQGPDGELEVFWVRRAPTLRFMGGWYAFPGGGLSRRDAQLPVAGLPAGTDTTTFHDPLPADDPADRAPLGPDLPPGLLACALRELFEETGLLLTDQPEALDVAHLAQLRRCLLAGEVDFYAMAEDEGWQLSAGALAFAGRWLTPPFAPLRFDNRFFLLPWDQQRAPQPEIDGGELVAGEWIAPRHALARWRTGEVTAAPPILHILQVLAGCGREDPGSGELAALCSPATDLGPFRWVELRPGVLLLPLLTPTLAPATHTNAFLLGHGDVVLIDPATPHEDEIARLVQAVDAAREAGRKVTAIWLTHHHPDHIGAVEALRAHLGVPVLAHPASAAPLLQHGIHLDGHLEDGQRIVLGGEPPLPVQVLHTPGHTRGHLAFYEETCGSLICGDLLSALSTIVIDPPEGDMNAYLASLERVAAQAPRTLFPAHGPAILQTGKALQRCRAHRLEREAQVLTAWREGHRSAEAIVPTIYAEEIPAALFPVAARQVAAHLERLEKRGDLHREEAVPG